MSSELPPPLEPGMSSGASMSASDVNQLASRLSALETRFSSSSWLYGQNFLKRAFAMFGHVFVANLIIALILWGLIFACTLVFGISLAGLANR